MKNLKKAERVLHLKKAVERYLQHNKNAGNNVPTHSQPLPVEKDVSMAGPEDTFYESSHHDDLA
jgi:hypothetical protein